MMSRLMGVVLGAGILFAPPLAAQTDVPPPGLPPDDARHLPTFSSWPGALPPLELDALHLLPLDRGPIPLRRPAIAAVAQARADRAGEQANREAERARRAAEREADRRERLDDAYDDGQEALEEARWQQAVERFTRVIDGNGARADAAMYWRAYALDRMGQKAEALAATAELMKQFPQSRWLNDAKALELQVRQSAGQPVRPEAEADEELKLLALQALQHSDPAQAVPMLEKILQGPQSPRLKERALFVLAQSNSPGARQVLTGLARGEGNPDLQRKAIQYLGVHGGRESRELLQQVYQASTDVDIKRRILRSFAISGDRARVLAAATGESAPELRAEAIQQLGIMGGHDELWQLYQKEQNVDVKRRAIQAMFVGGNVTRMSELATNEPNVELRRAAIRNLGLMGRTRTSEVLVSLYAKEKDVDTKRAIVNALFLQNNGEQLVALARKETDPAMRKELVQRMSHMKSKVVLDYLMEILNKG